MNFSTDIFIFIFLPIFIIFYRLVPECIRRIVLVIGSLAFYLLGTYSNLWWSLPLLLLIALVEYGLYVISYHISDNKIKMQRFLLFIELLIPIVILIGFKAFQIMPLGISFYTFQIISLQVDLWKGSTKVDFFEYFGFLFCFPKLTMGPIARYDSRVISKNAKSFKERIQNLVKDIEPGYKDFTVGLAMKVLLADQLATLWTSISVSGAASISVATAWLGALSYTLELFMDFWGYSIMALGLGKMLGIKIPINFDDPYASKTVSEFWRRWHITLGNFFRDYVYIPLGGSRNGSFKTFINLLIVWLLTGIWHGNGINFLIWGVVLFIFIALERFTPLGKLQDSKVLGHVYICLLMPITWMIFANNSFADVYQYIGRMVGISFGDTGIGANQFGRYIESYWLLIIIAIFVSTPFARKLYKRIKNNALIAIPLLILFWFSILMIGKGSGNPFMYYQF